MSYVTHTQLQIHLHVRRIPVLYTEKEAAGFILSVAGSETKFFRVLFDFDSDEEKARPNATNECFFFEGTTAECMHSIFMHESSIMCTYVHTCVHIHA